LVGFDKNNIARGYGRRQPPLSDSMLAHGMKYVGACVAGGERTEAQQQDDADRRVAGLVEKVPAGARSHGTSHLLHGMGCARHVHSARALALQAHRARLAAPQPVSTMKQLSTCAMSDVRVRAGCCAPVKAADAEKRANQREHSMPVMEGSPSALALRC
jgi:hypothetical protein